MKNLITIVVLVVVGIFVYNHFNALVSEADQYLIDMETQFKDAAKLMKQSGRAAAAAGIDTTSSFESAIETIKGIRDELTDYIDELEDEKIVEKAGRLKVKIEDFLESKGVSF